MTAFERIAGVTRVSVLEHRNGHVGYEVESARGADIRRDLANTVVTNGWGLLELRPSRMSLEEIFLHLTTEETRDEGRSTETQPAAEPAAQPAAPGEEGPWVSTTEPVQPKSKR